jgi:hypothetical protein
MTVARRATHQIMMIAAPVPQTINAVISLGTHRPALVESEDAACRIPAHPFIRARWQIDLRRRSKWTENDCFNEI